MLKEFPEELSWERWYAKYNDKKDKTGSTLKAKLKKLSKKGKPLGKGDLYPAIDRVVDKFNGETGKQRE